MGGGGGYGEAVSCMFTANVRRSAALVVDLVKEPAVEPDWKALKLCCRQLRRLAQPAKHRSSANDCRSHRSMRACDLRSISGFSIFFSFLFDCPVSVLFFFFRFR